MPYLKKTIIAGRTIEIRKSYAARYGCRGGRREKNHRPTPEDQRRVFLRRYWFGDAVSDIAARFSMREGTVKSNLHRIREKLRLTLEQEGVAL